MVALEISSLGHQMRHMIRARDNGIHKCFTEAMEVFYEPPPNDRHGGVMVTFGGEHHPKRQDVSRQLSAFRAETGIRALLAFQIEAILNMVFRPTTTLASKTIRRLYGDRDGDANTDVTLKGTSTMESTDDDIGMLAINDLFTGSGKTLMTILAAIIFADRRRHEIIGRVGFLMREQQNTGNWAFRVQCSTPDANANANAKSPTPVYSNVVVVMCAKHLFSQWKLACASALHILGMETSGATGAAGAAGVTVLENPLPGSQALLQNNSNIKIVLLHSVANLTRLNLEFVPAIIVDEFTIKSISNVLTKSAELLPLHGRMLLVSADAGSAELIIHRSHRRSFLRKMLCWDDIGYGENAHAILKASISLVSASVLPTMERDMVGEFMIDQLYKITYEKYTVSYTPSFASRLFGNNFEMSAISGSRLIEDRFGIVLTGTRTVGQLLSIVTDAVDNLARTDRRSTMLEPLTQLRDKLGTFVGEKEACPICFEEYDIVSGASLINPCWHIVCDTCLRTMMMAMNHETCPMCRTKIEGHTTTIVDRGEQQQQHHHHHHHQQQQDEARREGERGGQGMSTTQSLFDNMDTILEPTAGLEKACIDTLRCISADVADRPYKIVMIVPDQDFFTTFAVAVREEIGTSRIDIIEFKTNGTKRKPVTGKIVHGQIASFASDEGSPMKILFTTEGKTDSLTGLDFPRVDCIMSLGDGNSLQRLGRLTRLPRMMDPDVAARSVRYVCFEPVS